MYVEKHPSPRQWFQNHVVSFIHARDTKINLNTYNLAYLKVTARVLEVV